MADGLVDQFGHPLRRRKLPAGVDLFFQLPQVEALSNWDVKLAKEHALAHDNGQLNISARLYYAMTTDPRVDDGISKLLLALRGMPYEILPGPGRGGRTVWRKFMRRYGWTDKGPTGVNRVISPACQAELFSQQVLLGLGTAQPEWDYDRELGDGWYYPEVRTWHPQLLYYLPLAQPQQSGSSVPGQLYTYAWGSEKNEPSSQIPIITGTGQWLVFATMGDQRPWLHGKVRTLWRAWVSRLMAMLNWLRYNDVHGLPMRVIEVPTGMKKTPEVQEFYAALKKPGREATLLAPQLTTRDGKTGGVNLRLVEPVAKSWESFLAMLQFHGTEMTIDLTGGTQNAEAVGGNYMGAADQKDIRHEVKAANASAYGAFLNEQLLVPFATLNGYEGDAAPQIVYDTRPPRNRAEDAKAQQEESKAFAEAAKALGELNARGIFPDPATFLRERGLNLPAGTTFGPPRPAAPAPPA